MDSLAIQRTIEKYFGSTTECLGDLAQKNHIGQALVIAYSAVDTFGLLDAPPNQVSSSGSSFQDWTSKYLLPQPGINFSAIDFWSARCAVLHTSTSESDLSRAGRARELVYYNGDSSHPAAVDFVQRTAKIENGRYLAVNIADLFIGLLSAMSAFAPQLHSKCQSDPQVAARLRKVLQLHAWPPPNNSVRSFPSTRDA